MQVTVGEQVIVDPVIQFNAQCIPAFTYRATQDPFIFGLIAEGITTLLVNAISSGATGSLLAIFPGMAADIFGVTEKTYFLEVGIFLVLFAAFVMFVATRKPIKVSAVMLITTLDLLWVLGSMVAVFMLAGIVSTTGIVLIVAVAAWVAMMALLQFKGTQAARAGI